MKVSPLQNPDYLIRLDAPHFVFFKPKRVEGSTVAHVLIGQYDNDQKLISYEPAMETYFTTPVYGKRIDYENQIDIDAATSWCNDFILFKSRIDYSDLQTRLVVRRPAKIGENIQGTNPESDRLEVEPEVDTKEDPVVELEPENPEVETKEELD